MNNTGAFPALHTERLDLIEITHPHATDMFRLLADERVTEYYPVFSFEREEELLPVIASFTKEFKAGNGIRWGIALKGRKDIIGTIGYHGILRGHKGTLLFALMPEHHNKGYITEALKEVVRFGFETLELKRIEAEVMPGNVASDIVLAKAGFTYEGLLRQWMYWNGRQYDIKMYSLIRK